MQEGTLLVFTLKRIYTHPAVRKEVGRLRQREREEKTKPQNNGVQIVYDAKRRVLLRGDTVIDRFTPKFF